MKELIYIIVLVFCPIIIPIVVYYCDPSGEFVCSEDQFFNLTGADQ